MANESQSSVVLLPIKPEFANAIFTGEKRVEFRKQIFKRPVSHVIVYSSAPDKKIIGFFKLGFVDVAAPMTIWKRHRGSGVISFAGYKAYFKGKKQAVAFGITAPCRLKNPVSLTFLRTGQKAPQSYCYLEKRYLKKLNQLASKSGVSETS